MRSGIVDQAPAWTAKAGGPLSLAETMHMGHGFDSVYNIREMEKLDVDCIIPLPDSDKPYEMMQEHHGGTGGKGREYAMPNKYGRSATMTLVSPQEKPRQERRDVRFVRGFHHQYRGGRSRVVHAVDTRDVPSVVGHRDRIPQDGRGQGTDQRPRQAARPFPTFFTIVVLAFGCCTRCTQTWWQGRFGAFRLCGRPFAVHRAHRQAP